MRTETLLMLAQTAIKAQQSMDPTKGVYDLDVEGAPKTGGGGEAKIAIIVGFGVTLMMDLYKGKPLADTLQNL